MVTNRVVATGSMKKRGRIGTRESAPSSMA